MENRLNNNDISIDSSIIDQKISNDQLFYNQLNDSGKASLYISTNEYHIDNYKIDIEQPLPVYFTDYADAYKVIDTLNTLNNNQSDNNSDSSTHLSKEQEISSIDHDENHYALVYKSSLPIRLYEIDQLTNEKIDNLSCPVTYGITKLPALGNALHFIAILPKVRGKTIKSLVSKGVVFNDNIIIKKFLTPLFKILTTLHKHSIVHGNINVSNIHIDIDGNIILNECISTVCGHNQASLFETIENAQSIKFGKSFIESDDYYALGITIFILATGKDYHNYKADEIILEKLRNGTFEFLNNELSQHSKINTLIKGLCADDPYKRWGPSEINHFIQVNGLYDNTAVERTYINKPISFNDYEIYNSRELAHYLSQNWELASDFIKNLKIKKWLQACKSEEVKYELLNSFHFYISNRVTSPNEIFRHDDEKLIRTLILIDPMGPIRIRGISFNKNAIGLLILNTLNQGQVNIAQTLVNIIKSNIYSTYEHITAYVGDNYYIKPAKEIYKCLNFIQKSYLAGFGVERCIYELNPSLACQSKYLKNEFCLSIKDVLLLMNDKQLTFEQISDKHIISFIAAKLSHKDNYLVTSFNDFPQIQRSLAFQIWMVLAIAQEQAKIDKLNNLCITLKDALCEVINFNIQSNSIKAEIVNKIEAGSENGTIKDMLDITNLVDLFRKDSTEHSFAIRRSAEINLEISSYKNSKALNNEMRFKSLKIATQLSYIICGIIMLILTIKNL